jgi:hypothetical protein
VLDAKLQGLEIKITRKIHFKTLQKNINCQNWEQSFFQKGKIVEQ